MKLTDLKRTKAEEKKWSGMEVPATSEVESYPWGLEIRLETESLKKLGIDLNKFKIGQKVMITAETSVDEIRSSERRGEDSSTLGLQIQKLALDGKGQSKFGKYKEAVDGEPGD